MSGTFSHDKILTGAVVAYADGTSGTCLGVTQDDTEFHVDTQTRERLTARYGETPVDIIHTGAKVTVSMTLAECCIQALETAMPEGVTVSNTRYFGRIPGGKMSTHTVLLLLRPVGKDASDDGTEDSVLYKAVVTACDAIGFNNESDRVFRVTFTAMVDDTKTDGKKLGYIGALANPS